MRNRGGIGVGAAVALGAATLILVLGVSVIGTVISFNNGTFMHVPVALATSGKKRVEPEGMLWTSVIAATGQPRLFGRSGLPSQRG